jgi:hypothetical protein
VKDSRTGRPHGAGHREYARGDSGRDIGGAGLDLPMTTDGWHDPIYADDHVYESQVRRFACSSSSRPV